MSNVITIQSLFSDKKLRIPDYHRDYVWRRKAVEALLLDIDRVLENSHYLGTIIISKAEDGVFDVVDGQQRLTTIVLIIQVFLTQLTCAELNYRQDIEARRLNLTIDFGRNKNFVAALFDYTPVETQSIGQERLAEAYQCITERAKAAFAIGGDALVKKWLQTILHLEVIPYCIDRTKNQLADFNISH
jgi:hypothetical protein